MKLSSRVLIGLLAALGALAYCNSLPGILFWDSEALVLNNVFLRSWSYLPEIWTTSVMAGGGQVTNYYRPFAVTLLLVQYQLWGPSPLGYHAVNLLLHLANGALLFVLARRLGFKDLAAFGAAALFLLHPIQNETVNYVDHMESLLAVGLGLGALLLHGGGRRAWAALCLALSLLSKEEGAVFGPLIFLYEWLRPGEPAPKSSPKKRLAALWPYAVPLAVYAVLRLTVFNFLGGSPWEFGAQKGAYAPLPVRLLTFAKALIVYFRLLAWPAGLHFDRDMTPAAGLEDPWAWGAAAVDGAILALLWRVLRGRPEGRFGLLWFLAGLLPTSGIIPFNNILAEHFLYLPSAGLFLALAAAAGRLEGRIPRRVAAPALACLAAAYVAVNVRRNRDWQDPVRLYETTLAGNPASFRAANNLGVEHFRRRDLETASRGFQHSLRANPAYAPAFNNMGAVAEALGEPAQALEWYLRAGRAEPGYALARRNAASLLLKAGRLEEAEAEARAALKVHPADADAWQVLGAALFERRRLPEAREALEKAAGLSPTPGNFHNLSVVFERLGLRQEAAEARARRDALTRR